MTEKKGFEESSSATEGVAEEPQGAGTDGAPESGPERDVASAEEVTTEVEELRRELEALNDQHLRLAAEFDNYRKRNARERTAQAAQLQADLVGPLLDVLDDLQRVEDSGPTADAESVLEGVRLVEKKFLGVLEGAGLEPVQAEGAPFDPERMEALMAVPTDDPDRDGRVADVFQAGYTFRGVLIRPARVRVWQHTPGSDE